MKPALSKKTLIAKNHQFTLNQVYLTVHCYHCREAVWGVQPMAYFCQSESESNGYTHLNGAFVCSSIANNKRILPVKDSSSIETLFNNI